MAHYDNTPTSPSSYSRWDHIVDSDDEKVDDEPPIAPRPAPIVPPLNIRDDLEDYFRRLDERLTRHEGGPADVDRFSDDELEALLEASSCAHAATSKYAECSICLAEFEAGEKVSRMPCAAKHTFHVSCVRRWLGSATNCPLCRVDLLPIHRDSVKARPPSASRRSGSSPPPSPRALGFTRDGGTISRWEPSPPADVPRPDYVPPHLRDSAGYVEVEYPNQGVARVWRVNQGSNSGPRPGPT